MTTGGPEQADPRHDPSEDLQSSLQAYPEDSQKTKVISLLILMLMIVLLLLLWRWITQAEPTEHSDNLAPLVVLTTPKRLDVPVYFTALGTVTPLDTVTVKTQVNGQLLQVFFKEGQTVKKNELLAQIDPRPFNAQLTQAQGDLERDSALLANAKIDLQRYQTLWAQDSVAKQVLDTQQALVKQLEGTVKADEGLVASAKINLIYTKITSPINGRVGLRLVDPGNFVQTTDTTGLFVLNTTNPTTVVFTLAEDFIPPVLNQMRAGKKLIVDAFDRTQNRLLATGNLLAIDNQIDPSTGTVKLKALFKNENDILYPSQFVNVRLRVDTLKDATVIPTSALLQGKENYVFIINQGENIARIKPVQVGITFGEYSVINTTLDPKNLIIAEGTDNLKDGSKVRFEQKENPLKRSTP